MTPARYSILLDGAFVLRRIRTNLGLARRPGIEHVLDECRRIRSHPLLADLDLLRIYWYDARPASGSIRNPLSRSKLVLGETELYRDANRLLQELEMQEDFALRLGEVSVTPTWRLKPRVLAEIERTGRALEPQDLKPGIEQKGVDLRIGLDMARLALRELVSTIVVVTGDSDMIPAFKFVRREGVRVLLEDLGGPVKHELRVHADVVLGRAAPPPRPA